MAFLGGAWTPNIIWYLREGPRRFNELRGDVGGDLGEGALPAPPAAPRRRHRRPARDAHRPADGRVRAHRARTRAPTRRRRHRRRGPPTQAAPQRQRLELTRPREFWPCGQVRPPRRGPAAGTDRSSVQPYSRDSATARRRACICAMCRPSSGSLRAAMSRHWRVADGGASSGDELRDLGEGEPGSLRHLYQATRRTAVAGHIRRRPWRWRPQPFRPGARSGRGARRRR